MRPGIHAIQAAVCGYYGVTREQITSPVRTRCIARPRQVAMWLCRRATDASFPQIARAFGRDHTTVMHATAVIDKLIVRDAMMREDADGLLGLLSLGEAP